MAEINAQLAELTAAEGLIYEPALTVPTNSRLALELLHHAGTVGLRSELTERILLAYFAEGAHVGRIDELVGFAEEVGLDGEAARSALASSRHVSEVDADIDQARDLGARGVPFYVINNKSALPGAVSTSELLAAFKTANTS